MTYKDLVKLLLADNVYELIKENEDDIFKLIPELKKCKGFNQHNKWHVYDVYEHILHVVSEIQNDKCLRIVALFHDLGKPNTFTQDENGNGHFYNHWNESVTIFKKYQDNFDLSEEEINLITKLIFYHDILLEDMQEEEKNKMVADIGKENIKYLFNIKRADLKAQSPKFHYLLENIDNQEEKILLKK